MFESYVISYMTKTKDDEMPKMLEFESYVISYRTKTALVCIFNKFVHNSGRIMNTAEEILV